MSLEDQIQEATANQDWTKVAELAQQLAKSEQVKVQPKKGRPKKANLDQEPSKKSFNKKLKPEDHQRWHAEHMFSPIAIPNRPNKFAPEEHKDTKKYTVPNEKRFGEYAGQTFANEEEYLKIAMYPKTHAPKPLPAKKIEVTCNMCHRPYKVFESEVIVYDNDEYRCDKCLAGRSIQSSRRRSRDK